MRFAAIIAGLFTVVTASTATGQQVPILTLGKEAERLQPFVAPDRPLRLNVIQADDKTGVIVLFDPAWDPAPKPDDLPTALAPDIFAKLFVPAPAGCDPAKNWGGCCPDEKDTIFKYTKFGWIDTEQACGPAGDHGEPSIDDAIVPLKEFNPDLADLLRRNLNVDKTLIATRGRVDSRPVYLATTETVRLLCSGVPDNVCWTSSTGSTKCENRTGTPDRKWRKTYCSGSTPWETVGDCAC